MRSCIRLAAAAASGRSRRGTRVVRNDPGRSIWIPGELTMPVELQADRLAMMLDDGGVPGFQRFGGFVTVGADMRDFSGSAVDAAHWRK